MKRLLLIFAGVFFTLSTFAQNQIMVQNRTSCDLVIHTPVFQDPASGCTTGNLPNTLVMANSSIMLVAPSPTAEFIYLDGVWPLVAPTCFFSNLETDMACTTCPPPWGAPNSITVPTGGCGGCPANVIMTWMSCSNTIVIF